MRLRDNIQKENYKILVVDDEQGIIDSLSIFLNKYYFKGMTDPLAAIELLKQEHFDLLILDFLMSPIHGDQVVEEIRKFNRDIYILLLTGHKDLAPPLESEFDVIELYDTLVERNAICPFWTKKVYFKDIVKIQINLIKYCYLSNQD